MKKTFSFMALCIILSFLGCSCASSGIKLTDSTIVESNGSWSPVRSFWYPLIHCGSDEDGYVFEVHARHGSFYVKPDGDEPVVYVTDLVIEGSGGAYWQWNTVSYPAHASSYWAGEKTFLEVLIKKDNRYVGYAVVAIETDNYTEYCATVVECKEVLGQEDLGEGLSKETLQQMIDDVIQKY